MSTQPRWGAVAVARQLIEQADAADVLQLAITDALAEAGMTADNRYYVEVAVIELSEGCEHWPWEGASEAADDGPCVCPACAWSAVDDDVRRRALGIED